MTTAKTESICYTITRIIVEKLEQGVVPWRLPVQPERTPRNLATGEVCRGINSLLLHCRGFASPYWFTRAQLRKLGGRPREGDDATPVVVWQPDALALAGESALRCEHVLNVEQCTGIAEVPPPTTDGRPPIRRAAGLLREMRDCPRIQHVEDHPYYMPPVDTINMPRKETFPSREAYFATLYHEILHGIGHSSRLNRPGVRNLASFGLFHHTREELVAEIGAWMLCAFTGIAPAPVTDKDAHIRGWINRLESSPDMLANAGIHAQLAVDRILARPRR